MAPGFVKLEPVTARVPPQSAIEHGQAILNTGPKSQQSSSEMELTNVRGEGIMDPAFADQVRQQLYYMSQKLDGKTPSEPDLQVRFDRDGTPYVVENGHEHVHVERAPSGGPHHGGRANGGTNMAPLVGSSWGGAGGVGNQRFPSAPPAPNQLSNSQRRYTPIRAETLAPGLLSGCQSKARKLTGSSVS